MSFCLCLFLKWNLVIQNIIFLLPGCFFFFIQQQDLLRGNLGYVPLVSFFICILPVAQFAFYTKQRAFFDKLVGKRTQASPGNNGMPISPRLCFTIFKPVRFGSSDGKFCYRRSIFQRLNSASLPALPIKVTLLNPLIVFVFLFTLCWLPQCYRLPHSQRISSSIIINSGALNGNRI
ncbi:MAG TPA: hypothetical protein VLI68_12735 [Hanamia sp.]|nr:hypothetical protein [Hanamia sp.]